MTSPNRQAERGTEAAARACSDPAHFSPGTAIQGHGALLVLADTPELTLEQASANLGAFLGVEPQAALGQPLEALLPGELVVLLRAAPLSVRLTGADGQWLHASVRRCNGALLVELEPPAPPPHFLPANVNYDDAEGPDIEDEPRLATNLATATTIDEIARAGVEAAAERGRFDRTLITKFLDDGTSEAIAEIRRSTATAFLGVHFPASELSAEDRTQALLNQPTIVVDAFGDPVPLLPPLNPRTGHAIDLTFTGLRPAPPATLTLLRARNVVTAVSVPLIVAGKLWGILACHHETVRPIEPAEREMLAGVALFVTAALTRIVEAERVLTERHGAQRLSAVAQASKNARNTAVELLAADPGLLDLAAADGLALVAGETVVSFGQTPDSARVRRLAALAGVQPAGTVLVADSLASLLPEASLGPENAAVRANAAGILAVTLAGDVPVTIAAFRRERVRDRVWNSGAATWHETVVGHCRSWEPEAVAVWQGLPAALHSPGGDGHSLAADLAALMPPFGTNEPLLRALLGAVSGMLVVGGDGPGTAPVVQVVSRDFRRVFGIGPDPFTGQPIDAILTAVGLDAAAITAPPNTAPDIDIEAALITPGGGERTLLITRRPLLRYGNASGEREYTAWAFSDITPARRLEAALGSAREQASIVSHAMTAFVAQMSHELRTPLNTIIGFSEIMRAELFGALGSAKYKEYARNIQTSGESLLAVIRKLLDISKVQAGHYVVAEQRIDLAFVVHTVCRVESEQAERAGVKLMVEVTARQMPIQADDHAVSQMLVNLLSNSFKFTPAGGMVTCRALTLPNGGLALEVLDTGVGMPQDYIDRALAPTAPVGVRQPRKAAAGSGRGLALVRHLAELHGGQMTVTSHPRRGTAIRIALPAWRTISEDGCGHQTDRTAG